MSPDEEVDFFLGGSEPGHTRDRSQTWNGDSENPLIMPTSIEYPQRTRHCTWSCDLRGHSVVSIDERRLSKLECLAGKVGMDFFALSNSCRMVHQNASLASSEAEKACKKLHSENKIY